MTGNAELGTRSASTLTIVDDETAPALVQLTAVSYTVNEGVEYAEVTVSRTGVGSSPGTVSVDYVTSDVAARSGLDYEATTGPSSSMNSRPTRPYRSRSSMTTYMRTASCSNSP